MTTDHLAKLGGLLSFLTFVHFASDWILQSHAEAMAKSKDPRVRARHCAVYTVSFLPVFWLVGLPPLPSLACAAVLFLSHFVEDTYVPVYLWMRYVRRPPGMGVRVRKNGGIVSVTYGPEFVGKLPVRIDIPTGDTANQFDGELFQLIRDIEGGLSVEAAEEKIRMREFLKFVDTPLGKILLIAVDQIIHIAFLIPVAWAMASYAR
jgi:hypothetical protein